MNYVKFIFCAWNSCKLYISKACYAHFAKYLYGYRKYVTMTITVSFLPYTALWFNILLLTCCKVLYLDLYVSVVKLFVLYFNYALLHIFLTNKQFAMLWIQDYEMLTLNRHLIFFHLCLVLLRICSMCII